MQIRVLHEADALLYQQLRLSALMTDPEAFGSTYEREAAFALETVAERLRPHPGKFVLGAFADGCALGGIVTFVRDSGVKTAHKGSVHGMYVAPQMRGKGLGKSLLMELISLAKECEGVEQLNLTVVAANVAARKLYESVGFEVYGVERNALKSGRRYYDEELMALKL